MFGKFVLVADFSEPAAELKGPGFSFKVPLITPAIARHAIYWTDSIF